MDDKLANPVFQLPTNQMFRNYETCKSARWSTQRTYCEIWRGAQAMTFYFSPYEGLKNNSNLVMDNESSIISTFLNILGRFSDWLFQRASSTKPTCSVTLIGHATKLTSTDYRAGETGNESPRLTLLNVLYFIGQEKIYLEKNQATFHPSNLL